MPIDIAVLNVSTVLTDAQIAAWLPALQRQIDEDFALHWGRTARLAMFAKGEKPPKNARIAVVSDDAQQAGIVGFHDTTAHGLGLCHIYAATALTNGLSVSVTMSHELLEMLNDEGIDLGVQVGNLFYAREICDPPEDDQFGYMIDGVKVSDFVFGRWFDAVDAGGAPFDQAGHITQPRQLLPGGYIGVLDLGNATAGWGQLDAKVAAHPARRVAVHGSRRERRRRGRAAWRRSTAESA